MNYLLVALLGLAAGVISGLFGIGGAVLIIPGLVLLFKMSQHAANGTSLGALLLPVGLLGFLQYYMRGEVNLVYAGIIAGGLVLGALLVPKLPFTLPDPSLPRSIRAFLLLPSLLLPL